MCREKAMWIVDFGYIEHKPDHIDFQFLFRSLFFALCVSTFVVTKRALQTLTQFYPPTLPTSVE